MNIIKLITFFVYLEIILAFSEIDENIIEFCQIRKFRNLEGEFEICPNCGDRGFCNISNGMCVCLPRFIGTHCNFCDFGYYGPNCEPCPDCNPGFMCDSGKRGTGRCIKNDDCQEGFVGEKCDRCESRHTGEQCKDCTNSFSCGIYHFCNDLINTTNGVNGCRCHTGFDYNYNCHHCLPNYFGCDCRPCPNCSNNGICDSGRLGSGRCICNEGYSGKLCEISKNKKKLRMNNEIGLIIVIICLCVIIIFKKKKIKKVYLPR